jgi:dTDP-4-dehydrorhamnose reductase
MSMNNKILVTGANGQLGSELRSLAKSLPQYEFLFTDKEELLIDNEIAIQQYFAEHTPSYCINCAAYTAVDRAESDKEVALKINGIAPGLLAAACRKNSAKFIHVSTDYVFDGRSSTPYTEDKETGPINFYGISKLEGEISCLKEDPEAIIIRTAWVYSEYGNNFVKTMIRLMGERESISVVNDQVGAPTYAKDLAEVIMQIISSGKWVNGIYHYSNAGRISWFDFAVAIKELINSECKVFGIAGSQYPTPAARPSFSLLDTRKITETYSVEIPFWKHSLEECISRLSESVKK